MANREIAAALAAISDADEVVVTAEGLAPEADTSYLEATARATVALAQIAEASLAIQYAELGYGGLSRAHDLVTLALGE
jgi:hypothetical protein